QKPLTMTIVVSAIIFLSAFEVVRSGGETCGEVRRTFRTRALGPADMVPIMPAEVTGLSVCQSVGPTCCTPSMEEKYMEASVRELRELVKRKTTPLEKHFRAIAKKFRARTLITYIEQPDHRYFLDLYRDCSIQSCNDITSKFAQVGLITDLSNNINLTRILSSLFILSLEDEIGLKIPKEKIECALTKATSYLTPYAVLKSKFENLLNPVGVFLKALTVGLRAAEVSRRIATGGPCIDAITKMRYCSHCYGYTLIKTCPGLCHNVVRGCLVGMAELDMFWKYYIVSINNMANKLVNTEGGFDVYFPQILRNISLIVQSVTYNQESVTLSCLFSRNNKKSTNARFTLKESPAHSVKTLNKPRFIDLVIINLHRSLADSRRRFADELNTTRDFFASFSDDLCSSSDPVSFQVSNYGHCWDGVKMANSYKKPTPDKGIEGQLQNPEVKVVTLKRDVQTIIEDVRTITKELMKSSGSEQIPSDLLQRPSYITSHLQTDEIPCDDEDECFDNGSGE
uniref:Glypican-5 n=1 Tax=Ciona intestinalis TaxID=7719 RepID=F6T6Z5_CIOIN